MVIISLFGFSGSSSLDIAKSYAKQNSLECICFEDIFSNSKELSTREYSVLNEQFLLLEKLDSSSNDLLIHSRFAHIAIPNSIKIKIQESEISRLETLCKIHKENPAQVYGNLKMLEYYESLMVFGYFGTFNYSSNSNFDYVIDNKNLSDETVVNLMQLYIKNNLKLIKK